MKGRKTKYLFLFTLYNYTILPIYLQCLNQITKLNAVCMYCLTMTYVSNIFIYKYIDDIYNVLFVEDRNEKRFVSTTM